MRLCMARYIEIELDMGNDGNKRDMRSFEESCCGFCSSHIYLVVVVFSWECFLLNSHVFINKHVQVIVNNLSKIKLSSVNALGLWILLWCFPVNKFQLGFAAK